MHDINDSMFTLMLRFVGLRDDVTFNSEEFAAQQLKAVKEYVAQFPENEQEARTNEWIERHAEQYRKDWEADVLNEKFSDLRCPDCPLARVNTEEHCQIHEEWLALLKQYVAGEINSAIYVKNALKLLDMHKDHLKVKLSKKLK